MAKDSVPPHFIRPGDDPKLDALVQELRKDCDDGDPFYVDFRKRGRAAKGAGEVGDKAPPVSPTPAVHVNDAPARGWKLSPRWLSIWVLVIVTPVLTLLLALLLARARVPVVLLSPAGPTPSKAGASPSVTSAPSALVTAPPSDADASAPIATEAPSLTAAPSSKPRPGVKKARSVVDGGSAVPGVDNPDPNGDIW